MYITVLLLLPVQQVPKLGNEVRDEVLCITGTAGQRTKHKARPVPTAAAAAPVGRSRTTMSCKHPGTSGPLEPSAGGSSCQAHLNSQDLRLEGMSSQSLKCLRG